MAKIKNLLQRYGELVEEIETAEISELLKEADATWDHRDSTRMDFIIGDIARFSTAVKIYATNDKVVCEMSDNGHGIEPDNLRHIFDLFFATKAVGGHRSGLEYLVWY